MSFDFKEWANPSYRATYTPEDDKIRIYTDRVDRTLYDALKGLGFARAPKQGCFFQVWNPAREDAALALCGGIDDEDTTLFDRAEERNARFAVYSEHAGERAEQAFESAHALAERFSGGQPIIVGHHSERKARKDRDRVDRLAGKSVEEYDRRDYWAYRARAVKRHATYLVRPDVIQRRIKKLESDRRRHEKDRDTASAFLKLWNVAGLTTEQARAIANRDHVSVCFTLEKYPRDHHTYEGFSSTWSGLTDGIIDVAEARRLSVERHERTIRDCQRWMEHLDGEISYWKTILQDEHGADIDEQMPLAKGCWVRDGAGWIQVQRVNRGAEKRITSVSIEPRPGTWSWCRTIAYERIKEWKTDADYRAEQARLDFEAAAERIKNTPTYAPPPPDPARERAEALAQTVAQAEIVVNWNEDYFPTPPDAVTRMVDLLNLSEGVNVVLEPSAGDGRLADEVRRRGGYLVNCCELNHEARKALEAKGHTLVGADFLDYWLPKSVYDDSVPRFMYDRIVMNPPWGRRQWIKHVQHAWNLLRPGGRIVALLPAGIPFHDLGETIYAHLHVDGGLVSGFEGTNVRGVIVVIDKPKEKQTDAAYEQRPLF